MRAISRHVVPRVELDVVKDDPDDNRILECAVSSGSEYLVTGDKDLLRLRRDPNYEGGGVSEVLARDAASITRTSITLVRVGPVFTKSPRASK